MAKRPTEVTKENFEDVKAYMLTTAKKVKRKYVTERIVTPLGNFLFTLISLVLIYGAIYTTSSADEMMVFEKTAFMTDAWNVFSGSFPIDGLAWYYYWLILVAAAFIIPFAVSAVIAIIVSLTVHPKADGDFEGTDAQKAKKLYELTKSVSSKTSYSSSSGVLCSILFILAFCAFLVYSFLVLETKFSISMLIGLLVVVAILYFVYSLILLLSQSINSVFCKTESVAGLVSASEKYWLSVDPEEVERRRLEEERRIAEAASRKERAAEKRIRGLEAESAGRYATAKQLFKEAAEMGDALGMDNYARHCLIEGKRSDAIYWLQKAVDTGETDYEARELLHALKDGKNINAHYN